MHNAQQEKTPLNDNVQMVGLTVLDLARRKAEIFWPLMSVCSGFSNNSAQISTKFLLQCFPTARLQNLS